MTKIPHRPQIPLARAPSKGASILLVAEQREAPVALGDTLQHLTRSIGTGIVDDDDFEAADQVVLDRQEPAQARVDDVTLVEDRNNGE